MCRLSSPSQLFYPLVFILLFPVSLNAQITPKKLIREHRKVTEQIEAIKKGDLNLIAEGPMLLGKLKVPVKLYLSNTLMRMEMEFFGAQFYQVSTDTLVWNYDPSDERYEFEEIDENEAASESMPWQVNNNNELLKALTEGFKGQYVEEVVLDSLEVYALNTIKGDEKKTFYLRTSDYFLVGHKWAGVEEYYMNFQDIHGMPMPRTYISKTGDNMQVTFDKYESVPSIDPALFSFTPEDRQAYQEYLALKNNPPPPPPASGNPVLQLYNEGEALRAEGKYTEAIDKFTEALKIAPTDIGVLNVRGLARTDSGDQYGAISDFIRSREAGNTNPAIYSNMGLAKQRLGDNDAAIADFKRAIGMDSSNHVFYSNMGLAYLGNNDWTNMFQAFDRSIALYEKDDNGYYYYYRALARAQLEEYQSAIQDYTRAESLGAEFADLHNYKGVAFYSLGNYEKAALEFEKASNLSPDELQFLQNQGNAYRDMERYDKAVSVYQKLVGLDATRVEDQASLGLSLYNLERYDESLEAFEQAIRLQDSNALYYDYLGYIYKTKDEPQLAIDNFTKSLNLQDDSNIYYERGLMQLKLGNEKEACSDFKISADMDDSNGKVEFFKQCKSNE